MLALLLALGCAPSPEATREARWPRVGDTVTVEVIAGESGISASAWPVEPAALALPSTAGCVATRSHAAPLPGMTAIDVAVPFAQRIGADGRSEAEGPSPRRDASWAVGDVRVVRDDGTRAHARSALRFGEAADVVAVLHDDDGSATLRWAERPEEHLEILARDDGGRAYTCVGRAGLLHIPADLMPGLGELITLRAVRDTITVVPNEVMVRGRAVIETRFDIHAEMLSDRAAPRPRPAPSVWEPRRVLRVRSSLG
ncbi:MAG: hypothetical protein FJ090_16730 [Deltaproteobacteria bacterium]|nr:hypothetical protein [Deltaproteobacteria bacterium]